MAELKQIFRVLIDLVEQLRCVDIELARACSTHAADLTDIFKRKRAIKVAMANKTQEAGKAAVANQLALPIHVSGGYILTSDTYFDKGFSFFACNSFVDLVN